MRRVEYMVGKRDFKTLKAEQFMQDNVFVYQPDDTGETLANVMTEYGFGSVPVVDDKRRVIGIVTEFDLLKVLTEERELSGVKASEIMTPKPYYRFSRYPNHGHPPPAGREASHQNAGGR